VKGDVGLALGGYGMRAFRDHGAHNGRGGSRTWRRGVWQPQFEKRPRYNGRGGRGDSRGQNAGDEDDADSYKEEVRADHSGSSSFGGRGRPAPLGRSRGRGRCRGCGHGTSRRGGGAASSGRKASRPLFAGAQRDGFCLRQEIPQAHGTAITAICVAPDAVYTVSRDSTLRRWNVQGLELVPQLQVLLGDACWCMAQAGEWIFCGLSNGNIRTFHQQGRDITLSGHSEGVSALLLHQEILISGSADGSVRCWQWCNNTGTFTNVRTVVDQIPGQVRCLAVMADQLWVGSANGASNITAHEAGGAG